MLDDERDQLTGLWTRNRARRLIGGVAPGADTGAHRTANWSSIALLDLDRFKLVNDQHGHSVGDQVLAEVAARLAASAGDRAIVARWGGDEFLVVSPYDPETCIELLEVLQHELHGGVLVGDLSLTIGISGGVTWIDLRDLDASLRDADHAMYQAKSYGGGRVILHGPETAAYVEDRRDLLDRMARMHAEIARLVEETRTDALTGIGNRRALDNHMEALERRGLPDPLRRAVLFLDLDRFHDLNHLRGDHAGDEALRLVARRLRETCRETDLLVPQERPAAFRKGGEEFVVVAPVRDSAGALVLAQRLSAAVVDLGIEHGAPGQPVLTATIGVAMTSAEHDLAAALRRAGIAMGRLKEAGRRGAVGLVSEHDEPLEHEVPHETPLT